MMRGKGQGQMQRRVDEVLKVIQNEGVIPRKRIMELTGLKNGYTSDVLALLIHRGAVEQVKGGYRIRAK